MNKLAKILIATPLIIIWLIYGPILIEGFFDLDVEWRKFVAVLGLSILGVSLFIIRRHPDTNPHWVDSMGMLIIGIGPAVEAFNVLSKDDIGRILMPALILIVSVIWLGYFGILLKPREFVDFDENEKEKQHVKQTQRSTLVFFAFLLVLSLALFSGINSINQFLP